MSQEPVNKKARVIPKELGPNTISVQNTDINEDKCVEKDHLFLK